MERITYRVTLDVTKGGVQHILQGFKIGESIARRIEITLVNRGLPFPVLEGTVANMYVKSVFGTSVNACSFEDGKVIYEVTDNDTSRACLVDMQLKLFDAEVVIVSPKFQIRVDTSNVSDAPAQATPEYTALEAALLQAQTVYNERLVSIDIDENTLLFTATYGDGSTYESDAFEFLATIGSDEETRKENELQRIANETERINAELARASAETDREEAEAVRVQNENERQATISELEDDIEAALQVKDDVEALEQSAAQSASDASTSETNAASSASSASTSAGVATGAATSASADATLSRSWAEGGTGTREGEDTNNAKYWAEQAASHAGGHFVSYDAQTLTPSEKTQARTNIGAASSSDLSGKGDDLLLVGDRLSLMSGNTEIGHVILPESGLSTIVEIPVPKTVGGVPKEYTYNGNQQTFEWDSIDSEHIQLTNNIQMNAGTYTVTASLKNPADYWRNAGGTLDKADKTFTWEIAKAQGSFSLSANSASVDVNNPTATINVTNLTGDGVISVASDDDNVATASISNGVITITGVATGTATITVTMADGTNYLGDSHTISVTATYTTQISLVVNGAKGDNIIVTDENGNQTDFSPIAFDSGAVSKTVTAEIPSNGAEYKFASANVDHWDGTADKAEKVIKIDPQNTTADVMPKDSLYYRGKNLALEELLGTISSTVVCISSSWNNDNVQGVDNNQRNHYDTSNVITSNSVDLQNVQKIKGIFEVITSASAGSTPSGAALYVAPDKTLSSQYIKRILLSEVYNTLETNIKRMLELDVSDITTAEYIKAQLSMSYSNYPYSTKMHVLYAEGKRSLPVGDTMNVTLTIEGAYEDKITIYDKYGEVVDYVDFATDATSATVTLAIRTDGEKLKFVSSVAKDSNNKNYYKWVDVDNQTTDVILYPVDSNGYPTEYEWYGNNFGYTDQIPVMTSDTTPSGSITYDSQRSDVPWVRAFDANESNNAGLSLYSSGQHWVQYTFANTISFVHGIYFRPYGEWNNVWYHDTFVLTVNHGETDEVSYEFTPTQTEWNNRYKVYAVINKQNVKNIRISMKTASSGSIYFAIFKKIMAVGEA